MMNIFMVFSPHKNNKDLGNIRYIWRIWWDNLIDNINHITHSDAYLTDAFFILKFCYMHVLQLIGSQQLENDKMNVKVSF